MRCIPSEKPSDAAFQTTQCVEALARSWATGRALSCWSTPRWETELSPICRPTLSLAKVLCQALAKSIARALVNIQVRYDANALRAECSNLEAILFA